MKRLERIVGLIAVIGIVFKLLHFPGGSLLTVLSFAVLSLFYFLLGFLLFNGVRLRDVDRTDALKNIGTQQIILTVVLSIALSMVLIGVLFKIQLWPGGTLQLSLGLFVTAVTLAVALFFYLRTKRAYYRRMFTRIAIIGGFGLLLFLTPRGTLIDIYFRDSPEYADLLKQVLADPENEELEEQLQELEQELYDVVDE